MARAIFKVVLSVAAVQEIEVREGAKILLIANQHEQVCAWFDCDPDSPVEKRTIAVVGTGYHAPEHGRYVGTAFAGGRSLVWHVFEVDSDHCAAVVQDRQEGDRVLLALKPFAEYAEQMAEQWSHQDDSAHYGVKRPGSCQVTYGDFRRASEAYRSTRGRSR